MLKLYGETVSRGIGKGKVCIYKRMNYLNSDEKNPQKYNLEYELERYENAIYIAKSELQALTEKTKEEMNKDLSDLFMSQEAMLSDPYFTALVMKHIKNDGLTVSASIKITVTEISEMLNAAGGYISERIADVEDIANRLLLILEGENKKELPSDCILVTDELSPSETIMLKSKNIIGIALYRGSENSHSSILARSMGIPLIIKLEDRLPIAYNNATAIIDSDVGTLILSPDETTNSSYNIKFSANQKHLDHLKTYIGLDDVTPFGRKINLFANISSSAEILAVQKNDARGIGLYRSEFFYMSSPEEPTEDELFYEYKTVATAMGDKKVIIRTLDIGADKQLEYLALDIEKNPALGIKGIRLSLLRIDLFKKQLKAIFRASKFGNISMMFPMVTSTWEVAEALAIVSEVKRELTYNKIEFRDDVEIGIMIETPAAALISDELALMVDFFSIGTNDLLQYTLAVDREGSSAITNFFDSHHKSILRMIELIIKNAHDAGIWAGVCGELVVDPFFVQEVLKLGIDEISVPPPFILPTREIILNKSEYFSNN